MTLAVRSRRTTQPCSISRNACILLKLPKFASKNQIFHCTCYITPKRVTSLRRPISASLHPGNTTHFEEILPPWRAVGNTASDLTGSKFEPQTSRSRDERVTARPPGIVIEPPSILLAKTCGIEKLMLTFGNYVWLLRFSFRPVPFSLSPSLDFLSTFVSSLLPIVCLSLHP